MNKRMNDPTIDSFAYSFFSHSFTHSFIQSSFARLFIHSLTHFIIQSRSPFLLFLFCSSKLLTFYKLVGLWGPLVVAARGLPLVVAAARLPLVVAATGFSLVLAATGFLWS